MIALWATRLGFRRVGSTLGFLRSLIRKDMQDPVAMQHCLLPYIKRHVNWFFALEGHNEVFLFMDSI